MTIALCLFDYFPYGGMQRDALAIARALQSRGARIEMIVKQWQGDRPDDLPVHVIHTRGLSNLARNRDYIRQLPERCQQLGVSCKVGFQRMPHLDFYYAADSCFAAKAYGMRGLLYRLTARARDYLASEQAIFGAAAQTRILAISEPETAVYQRWYQTPQQRIHLLPPGIRRDRRRPEDADSIAAQLRAEYGIDDSQRILLLVGSGFRTKGVDRAINALQALPAKVKLWIVGQDNAAPFLSQAKKLGVAERVRFFGGRDDVPRFLCAADMLVHPAYRENTGTTLLEAGIAGLPVIASAACGYAHFLRDYGFGEVIAEPFSQQAFESAIKKVLAQGPEHYRSAGLQFADTADIYDMPARAAALILEHSHGQ